MKDKSKLELISEIAQANNKNLELIQEINQLQSNWDSLKEDLRWEINDYNGNIDIETRNIDSEFLRGIAWQAQELLDKMDKLEGKDKD